MTVVAATRPTFGINTKRHLYPIVYVRGFTPTAGAREDTFYDTYYGYAESAVEKRDAPPPKFLEPIVFEGQLIRFLKEYGYVDVANGGLALALSNAMGTPQNPTQSLWISRFYDHDVMSERVRSIEEHAEELRQLICDDKKGGIGIRAKLKQLDGVNVDLGQNDEDYKVILIAHSMGGLVCRCLIQNLLSQQGQDPKRWIHRLVTIGTPHGGIELSAIPDFLEELVVSQGNALNGAIFKEPRMRQYLKLPKKNEDNTPLDVRSLNGTFPEGRCLCVIGSDHDSYSAVKKLRAATAMGWSSRTGPTSREPTGPMSTGRIRDDGASSTASRLTKMSAASCSATRASSFGWRTFT